MKRMIFVIALICVFVATNSFAQEAKSLKGAVKTKTEKKAETKDTKKEEPKDAKKDVKKGKAISGYVACFNDLMLAKDGKISKADAEKFVEKGQPIVLVSGTGKKGKVYFIYNTDGTFGGKNLAKHADKQVNVYGKTKTVNGVNVIIATSIEDK